ncbi:MAG: ribosome biogenesis GTP-binding protein YihA/YsxC, partial [Zoogloeaceae bacterium]|nr:ribosome biogenesis GTP-binding protein YihA/YsxC [Zoogloeaceae bacterium]
MSQNAHSFVARPANTQAESASAFFRRARFLTTVAKLADLPPSQAEVAFAGRSNAGKSSALNALCDQTRLAFSSKTPGRTWFLNYFDLGDARHLVDLPGYGFAKAPGDIKKQWDKLIGPYLACHPPLAGLILIMDCRHPLTPLDWQMLDFFLPTGKPVHIVLSKADKLSRSEQASTLHRVRQTLAQHPGQMTAQLFSSLKKTG